MDLPSQASGPGRLFMLKRKFSRSTKACWPLSSFPLLGFPETAEDAEADVSIDRLLRPPTSICYKGCRSPLKDKYHEPADR